MAVGLTLAAAGFAGMIFDKIWEICTWYISICCLIKHYCFLMVSLFTGRYAMHAMKPQVKQALEASKSASYIFHII